MNEPFEKSQQKNNLNIFCKNSQQVKSTGKKKKAKKSRINTHRLKKKDNKSKPSKKKCGDNYCDSEQKENRPLQVTSMDDRRINMFYKTQRKILLEEGIIEDLQSNH